MEYKIFRFIIQAIFLVTIFLGPIYYMIVFFENLIPYYSSPWGLSSADVSTMTALGFLFFCVFFILSGWLIDKYTNIWSVIALAAISGFDLIMLAISVEFWFYFLFILINGAIIGLAVPTVLTYLFTNLPTFLKNYYLPLIMVLILTAWSIFGYYLLMYLTDWRTAFVITGFLNIVSADVLVFIAFISK